MTDSSGSSGGHLPGKPPAPGGGLPARRLTSHELEAVIRRAVEIQAAAGTPDEGISEGEVIRIGQELGLDPVTVRRAITDVRGRPPEERGLLARTVGPAGIRAARTVRRPAAATGLLVEEYLLKCEYMLVQRRFPDRTRYVRGTGVAAVMGRAARKFGASHAAMDLAQLDVSVAALDAETCLVEVSVDTSGTRAGLAAGAAAVGGGGAAAIAAAVLATPIIDPLALLSLPTLLGSWWGMRGIYGAVQHSTQDKLESFLDRLEHNELKLPTPRGPFGGGGFSLGGGWGGISLGPGPREGRRDERR
ncbi:MAG TPA: hypothetical protein VGC13_09120 [Longimicrobium sp.]|jgi:hypothetical protein|uniref:hypothetical protein n=1 Tax=Longimicrobium sp. TaxID=2029185 RepID=UPI002EDAC9AE